MEEILSGLPAETAFHARLVLRHGEVVIHGAEVTFAQPTLRAGTALRFDGENDWVRAATSFPDVADTFTMECWAWPTAGQVLTAESAGGNGQSSPLRFAIHPAEGESRYGPGHVGVGVSVATNGISVFELGSLGNLMAPVLTWAGSLTHWTHVGVVYGDGLQPRLYVDGQQVRVGLSTGFVAHPSLDLGSSDDPPAGGRGYFRGWLDEVRVWRRALSADEILEVAGRKATGIEPGLIAAWNMDDGAGATVGDQTARNADGSLMGAPAWMPSGAPVGLPLVLTLDPVVGPIRSATLLAKATANGTAGRVFFEWGAGDAFDQQTAPSDLDPNAVGKLFEAVLTGLRPGVIYRFRPVVEFGVGVRRGTARTFEPEYPAVGGWALRMDGIDDAVVAGARFAGVAGSFTMECWARPTASRAATVEDASALAESAGQRFLFYPQIGSTAYAPGHAVAGVSIGINGISVFEHSANYRPSVLVHPVLIDDWVHVAVVYALGRPTLFLNGARVRDGRPGSLIIHPSADVGSSGASLGGGVGLYSGEVDEVRVWSAALTGEQIRLNMHRRLQGSEPNLVLYYSFEGGPVATIVDQSPGSLPAAVVGSPEWRLSGAAIEGPFIRSHAVLLLDPGRAQITAEVNPLGHATTAYIEYGSALDYGNPTSPRDLGSGFDPVSLNNTVSGLLPGMFYDFRVVLESEGRYVLSGSFPLCTGLPGGGAALKFDGVDDLVDADPVFAAVQDNFTVELWARPDQATALLPEQDYAGFWPAGQRFALFPTEGTTAYGELHAAAGLSIGTNGINVVEHGAGYAPALLSYGAGLTEWTHVAVVYQNRQPRLLLNGVPVRTGVTSSRTVHPGCALGSDRLTGTTGFYGGLLDEIRIWRAVRTDDQIRDNMHRRLAGTEPDLVRCWRLDEGGGDLVHNASSAQDSGHRFGPAWVLSDVPVGRPWIREVQVIGSHAQGTDLRVRVDGNASNGTVQVEWGPDPLLGYDSAPAAIEPGSADQWILFRVGSGQAGSTGFFRTVISTGGADIPGPTKKFVTVTPESGSALEFDGIDDKVAVPPDPFTVLGSAFTLEMWCWPWAGRSASLESNTGSKSLGTQRFAAYPSHGPSTFGAGWATAGVSVGTNGVTIVEHSTSHWAPILVHERYLDGWTHVALVYSNGIPSLYLDGSHARTGPASRHQVRPGFILGGGPTVLQTPGYFKGQLDQVRVWNRALNASEIRSVMHRNLVEPVPGLIWALGLDEGFGESTRDGVLPPRGGLLSNGVDWVASTAPIAWLQPFALQADGTLRLQFATDPLRAHTLEQSADLTTWEPVLTRNSDARGVWEFSDTMRDGPRQRFFRLVDP